jgi:presqualene diphosphate synthase
MNAPSPSLPAPRGSSFYVAMRVLPQHKRQAMFDIYGFCRAVDDIADDCARAREPRHSELQAWRDHVDAVFAGHPPPALEGLARTIRAYDLQRVDFLAIIDGMDMDVAADIRAPDWATLDLYCDRVASAVGRLSVRVFGVPASDGPPLAHHLGRALQLTNILRDLDEDAAIGRLYLPREALRAAGIEDTAPQAVLAHPALAAACAPVIAKADRHFREARKVMARCERKTVRAPMIMAEAYQPILARLAERGFAPPRMRVGASKWRILLAVLRHGLV